MGHNRCQPGHLFPKFFSIFSHLQASHIIMMLGIELGTDHAMYAHYQVIYSPSSGLGLLLLAGFCLFVFEVFINFFLDLYYIVAHAYNSSTL